MQTGAILQIATQPPRLQTEEKPVKTGDTSFMDALAVEQKTADQNRKITQTAAQENNAADAKSAAADNTTAKASQPPVKKAEKESDSKTSKPAAAAQKSEKKDDDKDRDQTITAAGQIAVSQKKSSSGQQVKTPVVNGTEKNQDAVGSQELAWLLSSPQKNEVKKSNNDDLSSLIDDAKEFVPGNETESEKLERSQLLAVNDPALFLRTALQNAEKAENGTDKSGLGVQNKKDDKKDSSRAEVLFSVYDERKNPANLLNQKDASSLAKTAQKKGVAETAVVDKDGKSVQLTMDLVSHAEQNIMSTSSQTAAASGSDFQGMLTNAIQQNAPEFVKAGTIVLKDNNQGTINLVLHPESLGNVKVSLSLSDKVIAGQITVHTQEAYNAFHDSLDSIKQAFAQNGFDTAGFNLSFAGNGGFSGNGQNSQQYNDAPMRAERTYGDCLPVSVSSGENEAAYDNRNFYAVDIVA